MDASLLTKAQKRTFFQQLDALLPTPSEVTTTSTTSCSSSSAKQQTLEEIVGRDDRVVHSHSQSRRKTKKDMARNLPASVSRGGSGNAKASDTAKPQKKKTLVQGQRSEAVLQGKRVLLVPLGRDVSRKRVSVWQDMVEKLGGVAVVAGESASSGSYRSKPRKSPSGKQASGSASNVDWHSIDIMIMSPELEADKAHHFFGIADEAAAFPPENVKSFTPEWLVFLMREHKFPESHEFAWAVAQEQQQQQREDEEKRALEQDEQQPSQEANSEGSGQDDEGSNSKNEDTRAIQRAPAVNLDTESLQRREDEMQIKKQKLVEERKIIFYQNNPGFREKAEQAAASQPGSKRLKTEAFVCQQSSRMFIRLAI